VFSAVPSPEHLKPFKVVASWLDAKTHGLPFWVLSPWFSSLENMQTIIVSFERNLQ